MQYCSECVPIYTLLMRLYMLLGSFFKKKKQLSEKNATSRRSRSSLLRSALSCCSTHCETDFFLFLFLFFLFFTVWRTSPSRSLLLEPFESGSMSCCKCQSPATAASGRAARSSLNFLLQPPWTLRRFPSAPQAQSSTRKILFFLSPKVTFFFLAAL